MAIDLDIGWSDSFNYEDNTTACSDGTVCPFPDNSPCCAQGQGINETKFNRVNVFPTESTALSAYYAEAGYTIPPDSNAPASATGSYTAPIVTTMASAQSRQTGTSGPGLDPGVKAGIGVGVTVGIGILLCGPLYVLLRRKDRERKQKEAAEQEPLAAVHEMEVAKKETEMSGEGVVGEIDSAPRDRILREMHSSEIHELPST